MVAVESWRSPGTERWRCAIFDDLLDDVEGLLDPSTPEGMTFVAGSGLIDDEDNEDDEADGEPCTCWCGCRRTTHWPDDTCRRCQADRHRDDG